jgi:hypothetical protein
MVLEICRGFKLMEPRPLYLQVRAQFDLFGTSLHQSIFEKINTGLVHQSSQLNVHPIN